MSRAYAVRAQGLGKRYRIGARRKRADSFRETAAGWVASPFRYLADSLRGPSREEILWALHGVSFEVGYGEVLGVIGRNGAGKSTLLKVLARITEPSVGWAEIQGRVGSLLEVGTGFHPELTGRENVYLNGAILGMRRHEIQRQFDEIVGFAEIEKFIDTPVKRYSSGMRVRLGFAVAAYLEPELLLVDEVLAVGDASFQKRCLGRMNDVARSGRTVLFVSHNMGVISTLTTRCLYLDGGGVVAHGDTPEVLDRYLGDTLGDGETREPLEYYRRESNESAPVAIRRVEIAGAADTVADVAVGEPLRLVLTFEARRAVDGANVALDIKRPHRETVATILSWDSGRRIDLNQGVGTVVCEIRDLKLVPGLYFLDVGINQSTSTAAWDVVVDYPGFRVVNRGAGRLHHRPDRPGQVVCTDVSWDTGIKGGGS